MCPQQSYQTEAICPSIQVFLSKPCPKSELNTGTRKPQICHQERPQMFEQFRSRYLIEVRHVICPAISVGKTLRFLGGKFLRNHYFSWVFFPSSPPFGRRSVQTRCTNYEHTRVPLRLLQRILVCHFFVGGGGPKRVPFFNSLCVRIFCGIKLAEHVDQNWFCTNLTPQNTRIAGKTPCSFVII